ncbi:MAG: SUMF1/EgtB/PvdO family nonheme iron enzyme [Pseudomonadota bacterium]
MADIFLSYSRADRDRAQTISKALEAEGFSVWWDKVLRAGQTYDEVTEGMLRDSKVVVVLWSEVSVKSKWVRAEATLGERTSVLVPAMIDDAERPIMFELTQSADLIGWENDREDPRWKQFIADIRSAVEAAEQIPEAQIEAAANSSDANIETTFWTSIKDGTDPADFEAYLERYPDGHFASLARNRLNNRSALDAIPPSAKPEPAPEATQAPVGDAKKPSKKTKPKKEPKTNKRSGFPFVRAVLFLGVLAAGGYYGTEYLGLLEQEEVQAVCSECPDMVAIPGGTFEMGSAQDEPGHEPWEAPQHTVVLASFSMSRHEVTFDDWQRCLDDGGCNGYEPLDRDFGRGTNPVMGISWDDAQTYIRWLSQKTGRPYRLPTEAEWEYAARAGTETAYWWGDRFDRNKVPLDAPISVVGLAENPFGLKGMLGNLREWVEDCYDNSYESAPGNGNAQSRIGCNQRVLRGGHYDASEAAHRSANRARGRTDIRDRAYGFRIASSNTEAE